MKYIVPLFLLLVSCPTLKASSDGAFRIDDLPKLARDFRCSQEREAFISMEKKHETTVREAILRVVNSQLKTRREFIDLFHNRHEVKEKPSYGDLTITIGTSKKGKSWQGTSEGNLRCLDTQLKKTKRKGGKSLYTKDELLSLYGSCMSMHFVDDVILAYARALGAKKLEGPFANLKGNRAEINKRIVELNREAISYFTPQFYDLIIKSGDRWTDRFAKKEGLPVLMVEYISELVNDDYALDYITMLYSLIELAKIKTAEVNQPVISQNDLSKALEMVSREVAVEFKKALIEETTTFIGDSQPRVDKFAMPSKLEDIAGVLKCRQAAKIMEKAELQELYELFKDVASLSMVTRGHLYDGLAGVYGLGAALKNTQIRVTLYNPADKSQILFADTLASSAIGEKLVQQFRIYPNLFGKGEMKRMIFDAMRSLFYSSLITHQVLQIPGGTNKNFKIPNSQDAGDLAAAENIIGACQLIYDNCYFLLFKKALEDPKQQARNPHEFRLLINEEMPEHPQILNLSLFGMEFVPEGSAKSLMDLYCKFLGMRISLLKSLTEINMPASFDPEVEKRSLISQTNRVQLLRVVDINSLSGATAQNANVEEAEKKLALMKDGYTRALEQLRDEREKVKTLEEKIKAAEEEIGSQKKTISSLNKEKKRILRDLKAKTESEKKARDEIKSKNSEIDSLKGNIRNLDSELEQLKTHKLKLEQLVSRKAQELKSIEEELESKNSGKEIEGLQKQLKKAGVKLLDSEKKKETAEQSLRELLTDIDKKRARLQELEAESRQLRANNTLLERTIAAQSYKIDELSKEVGAQKSKLQSRDVTVKKLQARTVELEAQEGHKDRIQELEKANVSLKQDIQKAEREKTEADAELVKMGALTMTLSERAGQREELIQSLEARLMEAEHVMHLQQQQLFALNIPPAFVNGIPVEAIDDPAWTSFRELFLKNPLESGGTIEVHGHHGIHYLSPDEYWRYKWTGQLPQEHIIPELQQEQFQQETLEEQNTAEEEK